MTDADGRPDKVEERLTNLSQRIDEQFANVDEKFGQMDQRFAQVDRRFAQVDQRFAQVDQRFTHVDQRFTHVDQRFTHVDQQIDALTTEVQKLRVLEEENAGQIKLIAEVQTHHGSVLQRLVAAVEPLKVLPELFKQVAQDHEKRIAALERARE